MKRAGRRTPPHRRLPAGSANRWRNHPFKGSEASLDIPSVARRWAALPRGRKLRVAAENGVGKLAACEGAQCQPGKESVANSHPRFRRAPARSQAGQGFCFCRVLVRRPSSSRDAHAAAPEQSPHRRQFDARSETERMRGDLPGPRRENPKSGQRAGRGENPKIRISKSDRPRAPFATPADNPPVHGAARRGAFRFPAARGPWRRDRAGA
jgi:hypothetical protein